MSNNFQCKVKLLSKLVFSLSFFVLGTILLYSGDPVKQSLGAGFLGTIIGYWIK